MVRGNELKMQLPAPSITIKADRTIWCGPNALLGIVDQVEKEKYAPCARRGAWSEIPSKYFTHLGENENGLWAGWAADWENHPAKKIADEQARKAADAKAAIEHVTVRIHLSTRGWGDYDSVYWVGDITRPDPEILAECRRALATGYDVDQREQTDEQLLKLIQDAREAWKIKSKAHKKPAPKESHGPGYCYSCDSYCFGDCGDYHPTLDSVIMQRRFQEIWRAEVPDA